MAMNQDQLDALLEAHYEFCEARQSQGWREDAESESDPRRLVLDGYDLSGLSFENAVLVEASLRNCLLAGCDFFCAQVAYADFTGADFTNASFEDVEGLGSAILTDTNLRDSDLDEECLLNLPYISDGE